MSWLRIFCLGQLVFAEHKLTLFSPPYRYSTLQGQSLHATDFHLLHSLSRQLGVASGLMHQLAFLFDGSQIQVLCHFLHGAVFLIRKYAVIEFAPIKLVWGNEMLLGRLMRHFHLSVDFLNLLVDFIKARSLVRQHLLSNQVRLFWL